jgi:hypothetical protein
MKRSIMIAKRLAILLLALSLAFSTACAKSLARPTSLIVNDGVVSAASYARTPSPTVSVTTATVAVATKSAPAVAEAQDEADSDEAAVITLGETVKIEGAGAVVSGNIIQITTGGDYRLSGTLANGMVQVNAATTESVKLILSGAKISNASGPAIYVANADKVTIVLAEGTTNSLTDGKTYTLDEAKGALFSNDTLKIKGAGALVVTGNAQHGIASDDNIVIEGGNITISAAVDGIHANNNITVNGGTIKIVKANDGLESEGDLIINGGELVLAASDDGMVAAGDLTINGGTINVTNAVEGIESKSAIIVNDGLITVSASDDGLNAARNLTINGGYIYSVTSRGDALDSNGTLNINGGVTIALGGTSPEGGSDNDNGVFAITGGTLIATGGSNSSPTANASTQPSALLGSVPVNSILRIEQEGKEVLTFRVSKAYQNMVFTSPSLVSGKTYTVLTGGSVSGGSEFHGLYTGATYSGGAQSLTFVANSMVISAGGVAGGPGGMRGAPVRKP